MDDLLSREEVIKALDAEYRCTDKVDDWDGLRVAISIVENLPSTQPETVTNCHDLMNDTISRVNAIDAVRKCSVKEVTPAYMLIDKAEVMTDLMLLPSAQPEQTKMIKEIRKWINSGNRGSADYFIVDKIEEIINKYE